ncbi:MAG: hypothetical protein ACLUVG_07700 [Phocaeicola vulgatus]
MMQTNTSLECVRVSKELINKYPELYTGTDGQPAAGYGELWTSPSLANVPGVILYREYRDRLPDLHVQFPRTE